MSEPTTGSVRVRELLAESRKARALRERLVAAGQDPSAVDEALDGLYADLGRAFVSAVESGETSIPVNDALDYELEEKDANWYTEDEPPPGTRPEPKHPLFDPEDLEDLTDPEPDLDESTPVIPPEREFVDSDEPSDFIVASITAYRTQRKDDPSSSYAQLLLPVDAEPPTWKHRLDELLALLVLPSSFSDSDELAVEASRVQWATNDLELRLLGLPAEIQVGVVAMLAARSQHLRARLDLDVGPRMSLDRLQRYRIDQDLPAIAGLLPTPRPEFGTWEEDARQWWMLLGWAS
jgi:hypothetical protein